MNRDVGDAKANRKNIERNMQTLNLHVIFFFICKSSLSLFSSLVFSSLAFVSLVQLSSALCFFFPLFLKHTDDPQLCQMSIAICAQRMAS